MDRLQAMRVFVAVADERGFSAASRKLAISPPTATRAVASLEERLGARLLVRTTRTVRLTEAGMRYLGDCKRILGELDDAEGAAAGSHGELVGRVSVTASVLFGRLHVAPLVLKFLSKHPKVNVRALFVDRVVDVLEEGIDVAVRIAELPDSSARAVRVGAVRRLICASPGYLKKRGTPQRPLDLAHHDAIGFFGSSATSGFTFGGRGKVTSPTFRLKVNSSEVSIQAALAGQGLLSALSYQVDQDLRAGRLRRVLESFEAPPIPVHVLYPEGRRASARVRAFVDFAVDRLREALKAGE